MKELIMHKNTPDETRELELSRFDLDTIGQHLASKQFPGKKIQHITWKILIDNYGSTPYIHFKAFDYEGKSHDLMFDYDKAKGVINFDLSYNFILKETSMVPKTEILETRPTTEAATDGEK